MDGALRPTDSLEEARAKVVDALSECFAQDHLTLDRFERLVDAAQKAEAAADLAALLDGLPGAHAVDVRRPAPAPDATQARPPAGSAWASRPKDQAVAVFGEAKREGAWGPAADTKAVAVMGSVVLDYRDAKAPPADVTVFAVTFFGSVEIVVPPGYNVECSVSAIFGSAEHHALDSASAPTPDADAPTLHVRGVSVFGSVEVHYRHRGETKREAKRRIRLERRERRRLAKRSRVR